MSKDVKVLDYVVEKRKRCCEKYCTNSGVSTESRNRVFLLFLLMFFLVLPVALIALSIWWQSVFESGEICTTDEQNTETCETLTSFQVVTYWIYFDLG